MGVGGTEELNQNVIPMCECVCIDTLPGRWFASSESRGGGEVATHTLFYTATMRYLG